MVQIRRILLPTDFSTAGAPATEYACSLAEKYGAELHLLHVIPDALPIIVPEYGSAVWTEELIEQAEAAAQKSLEKLPPPGRGARFDVIRATRRGIAHAEITRYARENDVDLIVMGTHGRTGLMHVLLGSIAERTVRLAPCAVLTVRPAATAEVSGEAPSAGKAHA
jgi:nucleotide-binding universal stress UspA family protein